MYSWPARKRMQDWELSRRELYTEDVYIRPQVTSHFSCNQTAGPSVWLPDHQRASLTDSKLHEKQSRKGKEKDFYIAVQNKAKKHKCLCSSIKVHLSLTPACANAS